MSEQNVEAIQRVYRAAANGEASGRNWLDERISFRHRSFAGLTRMAETVSDPQWRPERYIDLNERVLVRVQLSGRGSESGDEIETRIAHLWSFPRGEIARLAIYHDWESGLEAAGLAE
jgi:ketosteroid isomerase-like protein